MKRIILAFLALALVGLASPAAADWQFTKWGMTPEQVVKKSPTPVKKVAPEDRDQGGHLTIEKGMPNLLEGDWTSGAFKFHVTYRFDARRHLSAVDLEILEDGQAMDVANALSDRYGKPDQEIGGITLARIWRTPREQIEYLGPLLPFKDEHGTEQKGFHGMVMYVWRRND